MNISNFTSRSLQLLILPREKASQAQKIARGDLVNFHTSAIRAKANIILLRETLTRFNTHPRWSNK